MEALRVDTKTPEDFLAHLLAISKLCGELRRDSWNDLREKKVERKDAIVLAHGYSERMVNESIECTYECFKLLYYTPSSNVFAIETLEINLAKAEVMLGMNDFKIKYGVNGVLIEKKLFGLFKDTDAILNRRRFEIEQETVKTVEHPPMLYIHDLKSRHVAFYSKLLRTLEDCVY